MEPRPTASGGMAAARLSKQAASTISQSFTGAEQVAKQFPQASSRQLVAAAKEAFVSGKTAALVFATVTAAVGFVVVVVFFPKHDEELRTYREIAAGSSGPGADADEGDARPS